ncbi:MAG: hypothetical protein IPJ30_14305 [Acidobacteria bacterium]|nr:hypothetical protein [Acidobacteriota bacterium]
MPFEALGWILSVLANDKGFDRRVETIQRFLINPNHRNPRRRRISSPITATVPG